MPLFEQIDYSTLMSGQGHRGQSPRRPHADPALKVGENLKMEQKKSNNLRNVILRSLSPE
jgi:hypothetical protein